MAAIQTKVSEGVDVPVLAGSGKSFKNVAAPADTRARSSSHLEHNVLSRSLCPRYSAIQPAVVDKEEGVRE